MLEHASIGLDGVESCRKTLAVVSALEAEARLGEAS
jgi:hypothetical protein